MLLLLPLSPGLGDGPLHLIVPLIVHLLHHLKHHKVRDGELVTQTDVHQTRAGVGLVVQLRLVSLLLVVRCHLLGEGDVAPVAAWVVLGKEEQEVVRLHLVVTLVGVYLVAGLLDAEGEDLVLRLGDGAKSEADGLVGEVQLDVVGRTLVEPLQPREVELDELLALVPGCNNMSGQTSRQTPRQCLTVILQLRLQNLPDGLGWSLYCRLLVGVLLGFERIVHLH